MEVANRTTNKPGPAAAAAAAGAVTPAADDAAAAAVTVGTPGDIRRYARGESLVASAGIGLAAILLAAVAGVGFWAGREQAVAAERDAAERAHALATALAPGAELLIARDDLSALRRLVVETARAQQLVGCEVVLPTGQVVASSVPGKITAVTLPPSWGEKVTPPEGKSFTSPTAYMQPLNVPGRGVAFLRLATAVPDGAAGRTELLTYVGAIGAAAMLGVLLIYRRVRWNLRAVTAVRDALLTLFPPGATAPTGAATAVSPALGPEAAAWNALVAERDQVRRDALGERARESLGRRRQPRGDLDAACDAMSQGLILVDEQGRVKYANGAAATFLRTDRERIVGADVAGVIKFEQVVAVVREVVGGTSRRRTVIDVERADDAAGNGAAGNGAAPAGGSGVGVLRFSVRPVRREDSASAMLVVEDITQQRAAEAARHAFVAQATHELRTPLTNIRLYVETAIEDGEADPSIRTKALNVINAEARRLERIVGEMLSVAEIEAGAFKLNVDDVRLDQLFDDLLRDYDQQSVDKRVKLAFQLPPKLPVLRGDRDKVAVALHNLVGNALKYTPTGGAVTVRVEADDKQLGVAVVDSGIGIAADDCERIFERFYRANDDRVAKITGTGLGLTIAREVARLHGGDITVESQLNKGSTFRLVLPVKAAA